MEEFIVTVDGPAGSGKSTIAKIVASKYGLTYLDTGAMYRMIALYALENNVNLEDEKSVEAMLENTKLDIVGNKFFLNGKDVSEEIRTPEVSGIVSPARRRLNEYKEKGIEADFESVITSIKERDHIDSTRKESPLMKADDAVEIDSSVMTIEEVVQAISECIDRKVK